MATVRDPEPRQVRRTEVTLGGGLGDDPGWMSLFSSAFTQSRNPMVLLDERRRHVEVNGAYLKLMGHRRAALIGHPIFEFVVGGPIASEAEWRAALRRKQFSAAGEMRRQDGTRVRVEFACHPAVVTGRPLVLFVALATSRRGRQLSAPTAGSTRPATLSRRELEIVQLIALGSSGPEIAEELHVTHNTVRTHVRNAMIKLGAHSRAQLVAMLLGEGLFWSEPSGASGRE